MNGRGWLALGAVVFAASNCTGAPLQLQRTIGAEQARAVEGSAWHPVAVLRNDKRTPLDAGTVLHEGHVRIPSRGAIHFPLAPGEQLGRDEKGRIVAVQSAGPDKTVTWFKPESSRYDAAKREVIGELAAGYQEVPLARGDRVELAGRFAPGDRVPLGGEVRWARAQSALVMGSALFALSYGSSVYVGLSSGDTSERAMLVPIIGPWIALGSRSSCNPTAMTACLEDGLDRLALVVDGVMQGAATILLAVGLPARAEFRGPKETRVIVGLTGAKVGVSVDY